MDRHSQLQQLRERCSNRPDLPDLKETLDRRNHDAENLLQQQGRINNELQERLMRTRMVPFERMLPRLKRIVRQVAEELRTKMPVCRRQRRRRDGSYRSNAWPCRWNTCCATPSIMVWSPPKCGWQANRAQGQISLDLSRARAATSFSTSAMTMPGCHWKRVRNKAIMRGLPAPNAEISDRDVLAVHPFSRASYSGKITQISGRRRHGRGARRSAATRRHHEHRLAPWVGAFRIRLPFIVSVNRAR